ncbi:DUF4097 family beta strand repeat-containing protein [Halosimplex aquaticum]|uniref:DUF4097 family beta strand repeat-containing protein n=1 Tax=Halosimplex aquaticum TaxID=3026162 RepID=A0ABD5Y1N8_9EURY|nr:DUF4097 family beta strand repeat-containing protein [Halosimplex aquaticum]
MPAPADRSPSRRRFLRASGGLAAALGLSGCVVSTQPYTETSDREFDPGNAEALAVQTDSGDVSLSATSGGVVSGTVRKESRSGRDALDQVTVEGNVEDGTLTIAPQRPDERVNVTVSLDLSVPEDLPVVEVASENGDVNADGVAGDGTYRTDNGDIEVRSVDGFVAVESTNGDVSASDVAGLDGALTSNGDVTVDVPALRGDATCRSNNGDVTAAVPEDLGAAVSLRTSNGDAETSGVSLTVDESTEHRIEGVLGGSEGGESAEHTLELRSTNGDVTLLGLGE